jgi:Linalool dehydratase/isomerase
MARANYLPAATAYLQEAQERLLAKLGDKRVWGYWALENAWGNLRVGRDPVPRDNIMFTGFTCLQMALSGTSAALTLRDKGETWRRYDLPEMADILATQYRSAPFGLLACEPNWIYPLCNLITACGLRAADSADGRRRWDSIAERFRASLLREFTTGSGDFVAFRSSLTGIAPAAVGGAVMQAFPCLFLNALYPDLAEQRWERLRQRLAKQNWRRAFWPIDVGNYAFSRASSYAASAAAAVELGDGETARALLATLEDECPSVTMEGVTHRECASLWAHDLELAARLGRHNGLRATVQADARHPGPILTDAPYPDILIARATSDGTSLDLVLHPSGNATGARIAVAGLRPNRDYRTGLSEVHVVQANEAGQVQIDVPLRGRTVLSIAPMV